MLTYLSAGFGEMLGNVWLDKIHNIGFTGIRTDILLHTREYIIKELGEYKKLSPIFLFGGGYIADWTPETFLEQTTLAAKQISDNNYFQDVPIYFELGNEPDIAVREWREYPVKLADTYWRCYQAVKSIDNRIELITGGISNLNQRGLDWLDSFMSSGIPNKAIIGFHRYPVSIDTTEAHSGFQSRQHEFNRLQALVDGRSLFCTETGASQGPYRVARSFPLCWLNRKVRLSDSQQATALKFEWDFWKVRGVIGMVWYQHRDGHNKNDILNGYGIYNVDESEKASCDMLRKILK